MSVDVQQEVVCDTELSAADAAHFQEAIDRQVYFDVNALHATVLTYLGLQYWYELYLDDLPMWGMVGEILRDEATGQMVHVSIALLLSIFNKINVARIRSSQLKLNLQQESNY
jgi:hypothetical protein